MRVTAYYSRADPRLSPWLWHRLARREGSSWKRLPSSAQEEAAEEEAGRQINHPFSIAFQELGPRGGWRHGSIFWIVAQTQYIVCRVKLVCSSPSFHYQPTLPLLPHAPSLQKGEITSQFPGTLAPALHSSLCLTGSFRECS